MAGGSRRGGVRMVNPQVAELLDRAIKNDE
jgi:hypothetical protein